MNRSLRALAVPVLAAGIGAARILGQDAPAAETPQAPALVTSPMPFIGITPCRIADTRDSNRPPDYGPPSLVAGAPREFDLVGQCGIPAGAQVASLNITVVNPRGLGYVLLYPKGGGQPVVSTLNYVTGSTVANAAIVPLGNGGITVVAAVSATDLLIDTDGYFGGAPAGYFNTFVGFPAGNSSTTGDHGTAFGRMALASTTSGESNTAFGSLTLASSTTGSSNTVFGGSAMVDDVTSSNNAVSGYAALPHPNGDNNAVFGTEALGAGDPVSNNTVVGRGGLGSCQTGSGNIAIGAEAGFNLTSGNDNLYVDNLGQASESGTIRIGKPAIHTRAFLAGVRGVTTGSPGAVPVLIDAADQLGTTASSARSKEDVRDMGDASGGILRLRPVTFHYRGQEGGRTHFGLIAEEVDEVLPDLVVRDSEGEVETVLYHELPAMLLNELQKQQGRIDRQDAEILGARERIARRRDEAAERRRRIEDLRTRIAALEGGRP